MVGVCGTDRQVLNCTRADFDHGALGPIEILDFITTPPVLCLFSRTVKGQFFKLVETFSEFPNSGAMFLQCFFFSF